MGILKASSLATPAKATAASGTGITVNQFGVDNRAIYKVTLTNAALSAAALTADATVVTLPAKTRITGVIMDVTQTFTGGAVTAATFLLGKTVGGGEYMASFDCFTATVTKGLADADLGTALVRSAAVQTGDLPSWSATTAVNLRITTVTANTNALTQGSVTVYLITEIYP